MNVDRYSRRIKWIIRKKWQIFKNVCGRISFFLPFLVLIPVYLRIVGVDAMDAIRHTQTHTHTHMNSTEKWVLCRSFFPVVEQRLKMKIPITPEFTAIITGRAKTKSYLHRFKLADNLTWPCNEGAQTTEHIIYECKILESQRSSLERHITARGED